MPEALEQARAELKHTEDDIEVMTRGVVAVAEAAAKLRRMKRKLENTIVSAGSRLSVIIVISVD
jgi:hypothetical protein